MANHPAISSDIVTVDSCGVQRSVLSITTGLGWVQAAGVVAFLGEPSDNRLERAAELGAMLAAQLLE